LKGGNLWGNLFYPQYSFLSLMTKVHSVDALSQAAYDERPDDRQLLWRVGICKTLLILAMGLGIGIGLGVVIGYPLPYHGLTDYFYQDYETGQYGYLPR
jgi:hypothetical protein